MMNSMPFEWECPVCGKRFRSEHSDDMDAIKKKHWKKHLTGRWLGKLLCRLFGHKWKNESIIKGVYEPLCIRCGVYRDVKPPKKKEEKK
jgi:hypothetical protein